MGAASNSQRVVLESNHEFENRGLPPDMTALLAAGKMGAASVPQRPDKKPKPRNMQAKKGGGNEFLGADCREVLEELTSAIPQRQHQKYLKRSGYQIFQLMGRLMLGGRMGVSK